MASEQTITTKVPIMEEARNVRQRRRRRRQESLSSGRPSTWMLSLVSLVLFPPLNHPHHQQRQLHLGCSAFVPNHHRQPSRYQKQYLRNDNDVPDAANWLTVLQMASSMGAQPAKNNNRQPGQGLSPYFQAILSRTNDRQRFVTGKYPVMVTVEENPTQKWLNLGRTTTSSSNTNGERAATSVVLINNTQIDKSLASYSRFQWLDDSEREECYVSMELLAEIHIHKPGYLHMMRADGAGASAAALRDAAEQSSHMMMTKWNALRWEKKNKKLSRSAALYEQLEDLQWKSPYRDRLWVSGFTLAGRKGILKSMDVHNGHINSVNERSGSMALWPNEINSVPANLIQGNPRLQHQHQHHSTTKTTTTTTTTTTHNEQQKQKQQKQHYYNHQTRTVTTSSTTTNAKRQEMDDALLVSDGFLVPGKDRGGIYIVQKPGNPNSEWTISLTKRSDKNRWFYHRAMWIDLTGDGRQSILTARAKLRKVQGDGNSEAVDSRPKNGQLVWLEMPKPHHYDEATGTPLEEDGTIFDPFSTKHVPWKERVLAMGPDVMFNVADMDTTDDTIEVIASQFFDKKVTLHSIKKGPKPYISFSRVIDDRCGAAFGGVFANLDNNRCQQQQEEYRRVIDSGGSAGTVQPGDSFSHLLVTSHECNYVAVEADTTSSAVETESSTYNGKSIAMDGGSLFSYKVPPGKDGWKTDEWIRTTVASGFRVKGQLWNVINPGAPGFVYTFHAHKNDGQLGKRPMIAVAGDCAESAFIFRPDDSSEQSSGVGGGGGEEHTIPDHDLDPHAKYSLMCEIKCGATVGSIGIGYEDLCSVEQEPGYVKLYIPCYEKDRILVFALGSGEDAVDYVDDDGW